MSITVADLIEALEGCDPEAEVRLATQPSWPLEYRVRGDVHEADGVVFLVEASQVGYLPGDVAADLGWS